MIHAYDGKNKTECGLDSLEGSTLIQSRNGKDKLKNLLDNQESMQKKD